MRQVHLAVLLGFATFALSPSTAHSNPRSAKDAKVLILGGGVAGVIAARTLHRKGIDDFLIVEARNELGGRMQNYTIGVSGKQYTIELGPNWIQGTQTGNGTANPILTLARKYHLKNQYNDLDGSISTFTVYHYIFDLILSGLITGEQRPTTIMGSKTIVTSWAHQLINSLKSELLQVWHRAAVRHLCVLMCCIRGARQDAAG
jgi:hypothetical protein